MHSKRPLLLLDNCEHLVEACAPLAYAVLRACPQLKMMTTSREALGIAGETTFRVPSLRCPTLQVPSAASSASDLGPGTWDFGQYEAVRLFIERAVAVRPDFKVTNQNAPARAQLCYRLDGIPLAIELAAARVKVFSVEEMGARLDDCFRLLTTGSRTALPRHQTLRALIDWSYDLLSEPEQMLLRRLSVFAGGWTFEAAEAICTVIFRRHSRVILLPPICSAMMFSATGGVSLWTTRRPGRSMEHVVKEAFLPSRFEVED